MHDLQHIPILLTSSIIVHDKSVRLQDAHERIKLTIDSVRHWKTIAPDNPIVLCDGSDFNFSLLLNEFKNSNQIECLHFQNNAHLVQERGRGYGEGEIVRFAVENSKTIRNAGCFAKCTSKLWVENFSECLAQWRGQMLFKGVFENAFSLTRIPHFSYIDTRFYMLDRSIYQMYFIDAHTNINASIGRSLEECFKDVYLGMGCPPCLMKIPPVICGVGGGTGKYYKNTITRRLKEKLRYALIHSNPIFKSWFSQKTLAPHS